MWYSHSNEIDGGSRPDLSLIIPIHNEEALLPTAVEDLITRSRGYRLAFELLLVENGSRDRTREVAEELTKRFPEIRLLSLPEANYGRAVREGMRAGRGRLLVNFDLDFWDLDFARQALALEPFGYDIIVASKNARLSQDHRSFLRRIISGAYKYFLYYGFDLLLSDTHGIKSWRNDSKLALLIEETEGNGEIFDTELIVRSQYAGRKLLELPTVIREQRKSVTPILRRAMRGFFQFMRLWYRLQWRPLI